MMTDTKRLSKKVPEGTPLHLAIRYAEMQLCWEIHVLWPLSKFTTLQKAEESTKAQMKITT